MITVTRSPAITDDSARAKTRQTPPGKWSDVSSTSFASTSMVTTCRKNKEINHLAEVETMSTSKARGMRMEDPRRECKNNHTQNHSFSSFSANSDGGKNLTTNNKTSPNRIPHSTLHKNENKLGHIKESPSMIRSNDYHDIDPSVLAALPPDIVAEIRRAYPQHYPRKKQRIDHFFARKPK